MIRALYSAASGMSAQQMNVDNIANNLANANTNGFKMRRAQFQDLLYQSYVQPGAAPDPQTIVPSGLQIGLGTRPASNEIIFAQGNFQQTDNPLDVVIQGKGFFQVRRPGGELAYTRDGGFQLDRDGNMVTANGDPAGAADHHSAGGAEHHHRGRRHGQLHAARTERVAGRGPDSARQFRQSGGSQQHRQNLFQPTDASGDPTVGNPGGQEGLGTLMQGYVEGSNVSVVEEFINMIVSQRAYEANSKVVKAADEMYQQVNNITQ